MTERACRTRKVYRQDTRTHAYTRVHTPTSTHKHTCMHGLIHVCTHPETHAHTSTSASLYQTLLEYSEKEAPVPGKEGCSARVPLEFPTRAFGTERR